MGIYFAVFLVSPLAKSFSRSYFILHPAVFLPAKQQQGFLLSLWSLQLSGVSRELSLYFVLLAAGPATSELRREQSKFSLWKPLYPIQWETSSVLRRLGSGELCREKQQRCLAAQSPSRRTWLPSCRVVRSLPHSFQTLDYSLRIVNRLLANPNFVPMSNTLAYSWGFSYLLAPPLKGRSWKKKFRIMQIKLDLVYLCTLKKKFFIFTFSISQINKKTNKITSPLSIILNNICKQCHQVLHHSPVANILLLAFVE